MKTTIIFIACLLISMTLTAQSNIEISGMVLDHHLKTPLFDAHVYVEGTNIGTVPDRGGYFRLQVPEHYQDKKLMISHVGYIFSEIIVSSFVKSEGVISMMPSVTVLPEIIITAEPEVNPIAHNKRQINYAELEKMYHTAYTKSNETDEYHNLTRAVLTEAEIDLKALFNMQVH